METHDDPTFLSAASLIEIQAAIARLAGGQKQRADVLRHWLDAIVSGFGDRIHPIDAKIALRAGSLLPHCQAGHAKHRFHDAVLVATAQVYSHGLLTKRDAVFGTWTGIEIASH